MSEDHYIAQTYLKNFGDPSHGGMLHAYRKSDGFEFPCWPADVCREWDGDKNPLMEDTELLGDFRKIFEPHWTPSIANIRSNKISNDDKFKISGYIANLMTCTPAWGRVMEKIYLKDKLGYLSFDVKMKRKHDKIDKRLIEGVEMLEKGDLKLVVNPNHMKALSTRCLVVNTIQIYNQDWQIVSNDTDHFFVTSDNPLAIDYSGRPGDQMKRFLPITPHLCLCIKYSSLRDIDPKNIAPYLRLPPEGKIQACGYSSQDVKHINRLVIKCAENTVFSSKKEPKIHDLVVKYNKYRVDADYIEYPGKDDSIYQGAIIRVREIKN